jgi:uncharacterized protein (DUF3820 family)
MKRIYTGVTPMPFGKYKGRKLADVPARYLLWLYEGEMRDGPLKRYIDDNIDALRKEEQKEKINRAMLKSMY